MDVALYGAIATVIATIAGAISVLVTAILNSLAQSKSTAIQTKISSIDAATQLGVSAGQSTVQIYGLLKDCLEVARKEREEFAEAMVRVQRQELVIHRAIIQLQELLEDHNQEYVELGAPCKFYSVAQERILEIRKLLGDSLPRKEADSN